MDYQGYHRQLLTQLLQTVETTPPFAGKSFSSQDHEFLTRLKSLVSAIHINEAFFSEGQALLCQIVASYPHLTPAVSRDLLWYFSGDCMHFLTDEEIDKYSQLDELRYEAESRGASFNILEAKRTIQEVH
jgi:hypothetical protein